MGVFRKITSLGTLGLVDLRSDKERIARSTREGAKYTKQQTRLLRQQVELQKRAADQQRAALQPQQHPGARDIATRLAQLDSLLQQGLIGPEDHSARKQQILAEL